MSRPPVCPNAADLPVAILCLVLLGFTALPFGGCGAGSTGHQGTSPARTQPEPKPEPENDKQVTLAWDPSLSVVHGYHVYRGDKPGGPYERLTSAPVPRPTYSDKTVRSGRTYYYVVTAVGFDGKESSYSNEIVVKAP